MYLAQQHTVYMSRPTYAAHPTFFSAAGLAIKTYRYYDLGTCGLNFQGMLEDLLSAPSGAIVLLQACAHKPTGVDPTLPQWEKIRQLIRAKGQFPFFDSAYQGLVSGNLDEGAHSIHLFVADGGECLITQSYSKNMGLYGERVGAISIVCMTAEVASHVESQLKLVIRPMYSSPPIHGASIVATILNDSAHWVLAVVSPTENLVYMLDPLKHLPFDDECKTFFNHSLMMFYAPKYKKASRREMQWEDLKVPAQTDIHTCGYYIMCFMKEIVEDKELSFASMWGEKGARQYNTKEIDAVRAEWAQYVYKMP